MTGVETAVRENVPLRRDQPVVAVDRAEVIGVPALLTFWLILLFGISARQVIGVLGAIGTPAMLLALTATGWWAASRVLPDVSADHDIQPLRIYLYALLWYCLLSWAIGNTSSLSALQQTSSVRSFIMLVALSGIALLIMDGVQTYSQLETILRRMVWGATFVAIVGIAEFYSGESFVIDVPGLTFNQQIPEVDVRSIFNRPSSTTMHPIELSVVLGAIFPIALHFALVSKDMRRRSAVAAAVIGVALPLTISRTGIVVFAVSMMIMALGWSWRRRLNALLTGIIALPILWLFIPGLLGTIRSLFSYVDTDPSLQARIERVPKVMEIVRESPWLGHGFGTMTIDDYFLVDNQIYVSLIEIGIIGVCLFLGLLALAAVMAWTSRHHIAASKESEHLGVSLSAGVAGFAASFLTFDAFFYHMLMGSLFVMLGACGALWRITRACDRGIVRPRVAPAGRRLQDE